MHTSVLESFREWRRNRQRHGDNTALLRDQHDRRHNDEGSSSPLLRGDILSATDHPAPLIVENADIQSPDTLTIWDTSLISLEFSLIWFLANYFVAACLEYTSVASSTILTSTSSIFTLLFGALFAVESFSAKKLIGVLASFTGIILISMVDLSGDNDDHRGSFPHKSQKQLAIGVCPYPPS